MKKHIINDHNLIDEDIEMKVIRVKGLIFNSKGQILLVYNNNTYQFPGGHLNENEEIDECIKREILEEIGIEVEVKERPFICIETYDNNYFNSDRKVLNTIYYYKFFTDEMPDITKTNYDEFELESEFKLFYINFNNIEEFINKKIEEKEIDEKIAREMLYVIEEYNEIYGGKI